MRIVTVTGSTAASRTGDQIVSPVTGGHRIRQLDAVRGIAILVVILHNEASKYLPPGWAPIFANGWMGVDLFFVLSGFLITGILLDTKGSALHQGFLHSPMPANMAVVLLPPPVHVRSRPSRATGGGHRDFW